MNHIQWQVSAGRFYCNYYNMCLDIFFSQVQIKCIALSLNHFDMIGIHLVFSKNSGGMIGGFLQNYIGVDIAARLY